MSFEPFPTVTIEDLTLKTEATLFLKADALPSGYLFRSSIEEITFKAFGLIPIGFSLLASLITFSKPISFSVSSIGLPGS